MANNRNDDPFQTSGHGVGYRRGKYSYLPSLGDIIDLGVQRARIHGEVPHS